MTLDDIKLHINHYHKNNQTITALYWLLKKFKLKTKNLKCFSFREAATPNFILMTTEGAFGERQVVKIPENTFEFSLELMLTLLAHELVHVSQKTVLPFVFDKNEREWQAYYEMLFHKIYPKIPDISNFHKKNFCIKALTYYNLMGENSPLQAKYLSQKKEIDLLLISVT